MWTKGNPAWNKGKPRSEETKRKISEAKKGSPGTFKGRKHTEEAKRKISEAKKGKPSWSKGRTRSAEHRQHLSEALTGKPSPFKGTHTGKPAWNRGVPCSEEQKQHLSEALTGKPRSTPIWNKGVPMRPESKQKLSKTNLGKKLTEEHKQHISDGHKGLPCSEEHKRRISATQKGRPLSEERKRAWRENPKVIAGRAQFRRTAGATAPELYIKHCFVNHGGHNFQTEAEIPGFFEMSGRRKAWDFLLPDKKLAVETDGSYWHGLKRPGQGHWDIAQEYDNEHHAEWLGWRVVRISETILEASKPYPKWLRAYRQEQRQIKAACKPVRLHVNLSPVAIKSKAAHFSRVKLRLAA